MSRHGARRARWRDDRGQSSAMVIVMLTVFILFVALVANVGQAVNRRIALQVVADSGAWTGATKMAEGLNYIAWANGLIQDYWVFATDAWVVNTVAGATCDGYDGVNNTYNGLVDPLYGMIQIIDTTYGGSVLPAGIVYNEAKGASSFNARDLFPGETLDYNEYDLSQEAGFITPMHRDLIQMMDLQKVDDGTNPKSSYSDLALPPLGPGSTQSYTQPCVKFFGPVAVPWVGHWDWNVWYKKSSSQVRYFAWIVKAPKSRLMIFDAFFGPNGMPEMKAAAAARPVGGSIVDGRPTYVAEMVPVKRVMTLPFIRDPMSASLGGIRQVTH
jgi:Putative Flp pilus-assembly TadE/G-like